MNTSRLIVLGAGVLLASGTVLQAAASDAGPFSKATIRFEQNATDEDVEVVIEATGSNEGLASLVVLTPDGRPVVNFSAPDASTMGMRSFHFESPEPRDVDGLRQAYPEGLYRFQGTTSSGRQLQGSASLHHALPALSEVMEPEPESGGVARKGLRIDWKPVAGVAAYIVELEQEELGTKIVARMPASVTSMRVPESVLGAELQYKVAVGTVSERGNVSYIETEFSTGQ